MINARVSPLPPFALVMPSVKYLVRAERRRLRLIAIYSLHTQMHPQHRISPFPLPLHLLQLLPTTRQYPLPSTTIVRTHFSCTEKSSVVSSSSQLSSHKCFVGPCAPTSSSFAQSSTGKSSNSSSSSSWAAGFWGWSGLLSSLESETVAWVVFGSPSAAPDILGRRVVVGEIGWRDAMWKKRVGSIVDGNAR